MKDISLLKLKINKIIMRKDIKLVRKMEVLMMGRGYDERRTVAKYPYLSR